MNAASSEHPLSAFIEELRKLLRALPPAPIDTKGISSQRIGKLLKDIDAAIQTLEKLKLDLDPIKQPAHQFDPADPSTMGRLIARTMLEQKLHSLYDLQRFWGSGVYAIYYTGNFNAYCSISGTDIPIYVGKVNPSNSNAQTPQEQGDKLWQRLVKDHAKNIGLATNLDVKDFQCRYLVTSSTWQNTAESYLIDTFKPAWNSEMKVCYGFGKHGDHSTTRANTRSPWDELHPGRPWASSSPPNPKPQSEIIEDILGHYEKHPPNTLTPN